ncbi:MAG: fumarate reductase subunit D [Deltaproteobacteria bacterium]|nr:MAG: fumarate reductase subunit D [Deltaproteobacteria bacterium]
MHRFLLRIEPIVWLLFGQGVLIGTILLTSWVLVVGMLEPLGLVPADALAYERALRLGAHPIGRLVLLALIALPLWKGAHHLRHLAIEFGGHARDAVVAPVLYGLAALGSLAGLFAIIRL